MRHPILSRLMALGLPNDGWALFGSGPLLVRGWITDVGDLDVICRGDVWRSVAELGEVSHLTEFDVEVVTIDDNITFGTRWAVGNVDANSLIAGAERIDGIPCVGLEHIVAYKRTLRRPKDLAHLDVIYAHRPSLATGATNADANRTVGPR